MKRIKQQQTDTIENDNINKKQKSFDQAPPSVKISSACSFALDILRRMKHEQGCKFNSYGDGECDCEIPEAIKRLEQI